MIKALDGRHGHGRARPVVAAAPMIGLMLLLAGCGGSTGTGEAEDATSDTTATMLEGDGVALSSEQPDEMAMTSDDESPDQAPPTEPDALAGLGGLDAALTEIGACLVENGADVGPLTLADMMEKAQRGEIPVDADRMATFAFFLDADPTDPTFAAAVAACQGVVDSNPALAQFLPVD